MYIARRALDAGQFIQGRSHGGIQRGDLRAGLAEHRTHGTALLLQHRGQQVLGFDILMVAPQRQRLGIGQRGLQ